MKHKTVYTKILLMMWGTAVLALTACQSNTPTLLTTAEGTDGFQNFAWLLDRTAVYFNFGRSELWKFEVATSTLSLIASINQGE